MGWEGQRARTLGFTVSSPCASSAQAVRASGSPTDRAPGWVESGGDEVEDAEGLGTILIPVTTGPTDNMATRVRGIVSPLPDAPTSFLYSCCYFRVPNSMFLTWALAHAPGDTLQPKASPNPVPTLQPEGSSYSTI